MYPSYYRNYGELLALLVYLTFVTPLLGLTQTGCHLASPHAAASHLLVHPLLIALLHLVP